MNFRWWRRHRPAIVLSVGDISVRLIPEEETISMATTITVGQTLPMIIRYLDQQGQPMATTQTPDLAPAWTQASPTTDALVVAPDGFSATARGLAVGTDTVSLTLSVGGTSFSATLDVQVDAAPQVLTSIEIVPGAPV